MKASYFCFISLIQGKQKAQPLAKLGRIWWRHMDRGNLALGKNKSAFCVLGRGGTKRDGPYVGWMGKMWAESRVPPQCISVHPFTVVLLETCPIRAVRDASFSQSLMAKETWFGLVFRELSESPAQNKQWLWCLAFHTATLGKERSTTPAWSEGVRRKSEPSRGGYILRYHRDLGEDVHAS